MSDIVIKNIEIPKDKPLNLSIYPNGEVVLFCIQGRDVYDNECNYGDYEHKKRAIELPSHGNLKDEKTIEKTIVEYMGLDSIADLMPAERSIYNCIGYAPTVLEASEVKE